MALLRRAQRLSHRLSPPWDRRVRETAKMVLNYRGARAAGLRGLRFRRLARHSPLLLAPFGEGRLLVDGRDDEIGRVVFMTGGYERIYMRTAVEYLAASGIDVTGSTFLDIGANIGTSTIDALLHFGFARAICFEPEPDNARLLSVNLTLNDVDDRTEVHALALSDEDGTALLAGTAGNSGDHWVATGAHPASDEPVREVRQARLDTLVADGTVRLDGVGLVWIDIQGHEPFALAGAQRVTQAGLPLLLEYSPDALGAAGLARLEKLVSANYSTVVDIHLLAHGCDQDSAVLAASALPALAERYRHVAHTDLLVLR